MHVLNRVKFIPECRGPDVVGWIARFQHKLYSTKSFAEVINFEKYRCLVCHQTLVFRTAPDHRMVEHLHGCDAMTPGLRSRLPRPNRPPRSHHLPAAADADADADPDADPQQPAAAAATDADDPHPAGDDGGDDSADEPDEESDD